MRTSPGSLSLCIAVIAALAVPGCVLKTECARGAVDVSGDCVCPAGTSRVAAADGTSSCLAADGGADAGPEDLGVDAGPADAGPCDMECPTETPVCDEASGRCAECTATDAHACGGATPVCDVPTHACVACNADSDCTAPGAPQCDLGAHVCGGCTTSEACAGRAGTTVCDAVAGACVACTGADRSACGANVCDVTAHVCSAFPAGASGLCQTCVSDAQCLTGQLCVPMTFDSPARVVGNYCLWRMDAAGAGAPNGACSTVRPYVRALAAATSLEGATATVCGLRLTTCPGMNDLSTTNCMSLDATGDARCGAAGFADGLCRALDAAANRCTVECLSDDDCRGTICDTTVTPSVCRL